MSGKASGSGITEKIKRLNELMAWFDSSEFSLEAAVDKYAEATKLAAEVEKALAELKNKISEIDNVGGEE
ncbi:MAG: exodeoxyribonuclease VII small subunit [Candidatus Nomurabacteria bacterium]|jgi:exodeoxyribonuclease VII small subunit|nr:exodeoxyribonuclease VII small subunit [Candidatus Nomurabacteria bacterium]